MAWAPTTDQILDCDPVRRRADDFRFELWDDNDQLIGELHPDASRPPVVSNDTSRAVRRQLSSFNLPPSELSAISLSDKVRPVMILQNGDERRLGTFFLADESSTEANIGTTREASWYDRSDDINKQTEHTIGFGTGGNIVIALLGVLGEVVPASEIADAPESDAVFGAPVQWTPGTNRTQIITALTDLLGWLPIFFQEDGLAQFKDAPDLETASPTLSYQLGGRIFDGSVLLSNDLPSAANRFVVYETSGRSTFTGSYDVPATAPHSIANRGGRVFPDVSSAQGLGSNSAARKFAKSKALTGQKIYRWASFTSPADFRHGTWDVLSFLGETWLEIAWSITCQLGGDFMTHKLRRVY